MLWGIEKQDLEVGCLARRVAAEQAEGLAVVVACGGDRSGGAIHHIGDRVIMKVRSDPWQIQNNVDSDIFEMVGRSDAREHQQLRRADAAGGQYDLAGTAGRDQVVPGAVHHTGATVASDMQAVY